MFIYVYIYIVSGFVLGILNLNDTHVETFLHTLSHCNTKQHTVMEGNLPPRVSFLFTICPNQEPGGRGPPSMNLYQVLRGGSSSSGFLIRGHSK